jgi:hypothetical protein
MSAKRRQLEMHLENTTENCWVVSYNLLGKHFSKEFDSAAEADIFMYNLISFTYKYVDSPTLSKRVDGMLWSHNNSKVVRRWKIMIDQFHELDAVAV